MGHSALELEGVCLSDGTNCPAGTTDTRCDVSGTCSQVCIGADCQAAWPSGGWSGYEIVFASISAPGGRANCPSGKKVIGGGCDASATSSQKIVGSIPFSDSGWSCDFGTGSTGSASAYAICANVD
jgi:hypothetical protein